MIFCFGFFTILGTGVSFLSLTPGNSRYITSSVDFTASQPAKKNLGLRSCELPYGWNCRNRNTLVFITQSNLVPFSFFNPVRVIFVFLVFFLLFVSLLCANTNPPTAFYVPLRDMMRKKKTATRQQTCKPAPKNGERVR